MCVRHFLGLPSSGEIPHVQEKYTLSNTLKLLLFQVLDLIMLTKVSAVTFLHKEKKHFWESLAIPPNTNRRYALRPL